MGNKSFIDHFLFSSNIRDEILKCNIVIDGSNLSDHNPLMLNVKLNDYDYNKLYLNDSCKKLYSDDNKHSI